MASFHEIRHFLAQVRRRLGLAQAAETAGLLGLIIVSFSAAAVLVAWIGAPARAELIRDLGLGAIGLGAAIVVVRSLILPWRHLRRDTAVARRVEASLPQMKAGVLSCVELQDQLDDITQSGRFSLGLIGALAEDTASKLRRVEPDAVVSWRRPRRFAQALAVVATVLAGAVLVFPEPFAQGANLLMHGPTAAAGGVEQGVEERDVVVGDITYTLSYPAYTKLPSRVLRNTAGDLTALVGTRVHLRTRSLVEAAAGWLVFDESDEPIPLKVAQDNTLTGAITIKHAGAFRFEIEQPDGTRVVERARRTLEVEPDNPPRVELLQPVADLEVEGREPIKLYFSTADDYGLAGVDVVTHLETGGEPPVRRRVASLEGHRNHVGNAVVDLEQVSIIPGETVAVWLEVYDNNTVLEEPQRTESRRIHIRLHSPEERHKDNIDKERRLLERMLDLLADRLESDIERQDPKWYERLVNRQAKINKGTAAMITLFRQVIEALREDALANENNRADLEELLKHHEALQSRERHHIRAAVTNTRRKERSTHLVVLNRSNTSNIEQLEADIIKLDFIIDQQHQKGMLDQARSLRDAQREMVELLEKLKTADDPALRMQLAQRIKQVQKQIERMLRDMASNAKPTPHQNMNMGAFEPGEEMDGLSAMKDRLQQMQELIREGRFDEAMKLAEQIGQDIEAVSASFEESMQSMAGDEDNQRNAEIQRALADLDKIRHRHDSVNRDTAALEKNADNALRELVRKELAPQIAEQMAKIAELQNKVAKVDLQNMHARDVKPVEDVRQQIQNLRETLSQEDLYQALQIARELNKDVKALHEEAKLGVEKMAERQGNTPKVTRRKRNVRKLREARPMARSIARKLEQMMPTPDDLLQRSEKRRMNRLAERQKRVGERLGRFRDKLGKRLERSPGLRAKAEQRLEQAQQSMEQSESRLQSHEPGKAGEHQQQALDELDAMRKDMEQTGKRSGKGKGGGRDRTGVSRDKVAIPDAERYSVPKEFRDQLLRSIKERAPSRYRRLIEQYYEALVH